MKNVKLEKFNEGLNGKKVLILGLGVSNLPLLDYLHKYNSIISVRDKKTRDELDEIVINKLDEYNVNCILGDNYLDDLEGYDIIFRSPSILPNIKCLKEETKRGCLVTTEVEQVLRLTPSKTIGITGSDGKTTTTTLIAKCLEHAGYKVFLGGNIGTPIFTEISNMREDDFVVLELSSFQLMEMGISPMVGVITNITPNHLNIHTDMDEYVNSKKEIFLNQDKSSLCVLNYDNDITRSCIDEIPGSYTLFSGHQFLDNGYCFVGDSLYKCENGKRIKLIDTCDIKLRGNHNYENICTCMAAIDSFVSFDEVSDVFKTFGGVEHRLELVREIDGIKWYNDSVSSSPTRTIAGLNSYNEDIVLIAGGYDKNIDYTPIGEPIVNKVNSLIIMGDTKEKIRKAVKDASERLNKHVDIYEVNSLLEAVNKAKEVAKLGEVVLFSPASASFDMFKNFADRGDKFKKLVNEIE